MIGVSELRRHPSLNLDWPRTGDGIFLHRIGSHRTVHQSECSLFIAQAHVNECEIANQSIIAFLFLKYVSNSCRACSHVVQAAA